jgi:hypothetical protein
LDVDTRGSDAATLGIAKTLAEHQLDPDFAGWIWSGVEVLVELYFGPAKKLNIPLPR